ncbi:hypothetical protein Hdeb2414_s0018g00531871 [Helianthus debilis subsp. tardiflorus]
MSKCKVQDANHISSWSCLKHTKKHSMKVSFSLSSSSKPSNSTSRSSPNESLNNNKEFITHFDPIKPPTDPPIIIPPIPNEWNPQNQPMIIDLSNDPNIETDPNCSAIDRLMLMKLKSDLERLPDDRGFGDFDDVSVEDFARAYMKGYGWYEGRVRVGCISESSSHQFRGRPARPKAHCGFKGPLW